MKKWIAVLLMTFVGITLRSQAFAHEQTKAQSRAYKKSARKAQKEMARYSKQQEKAMRKSAKAQRKALKRAQHRNHL